MGDIGMAVSLPGYDVKSADDRFLLYSSSWPNLKINSVTSSTTTIPLGLEANFTAATNDIITSAGHGLINGNRITMDSTGTLPAGLNDTTTYWVIEKTTNTFKVSLTEGGSAVDITSTGSGTHTFYQDDNRITITHNLGYYAPFVVVYNGNTTIGTNNSYFFSNAAGESFDWTFFAAVNQHENYLTIDVNSFWGDGAPGDTVYFTTYLFLDDFSTVTPNYIDTGSTQATESNDYGARVSKDGIDVQTGDDIDCVLSSSFFGNIVHMKGSYTASSDETYTINHNLGYFPLALIYSDYSADGDGIMYYPTVEIKDDSIDVSMLDGDTIYYVIFKNKLGT